MSEKISADGAGATEPAPPASVLAFDLDFSFAYAARFFPPTLRDPKFYLIGNGGNGAYLALHVGRLCYILKERGQSPEVVFIDPDVVERKNIGRQAFCLAELGEYKSVSLARRIEEAFGVSTSAVPSEFEPAMAQEDSNRMAVLLGCVDNAPGREQIAKGLDRLNNRYGAGAAVWLDCGNHRDTGQVILGTTNSRSDLAGSFPFPEVCAALPSPALVMPDLLKAEKDERSEKRKMSCAELLLLNDQSPAINSTMADYASAYLFNLFVYGELKAFKTEVNIRHMSARSYYITPEAVERHSGVPAATLSRASDPRADALAA